MFFFLCSPLSWYFFLFYHMKLLAFSINKPWALTSAASIAQSVFSMLFSYYPCLCLLNYYLSFLIHLRRHLLESYPNLAIPTVCYTHLFIFLFLPLDSDRSEIIHNFKHAKSLEICKSSECFDFYVKLLRWSQRENWWSVWAQSSAHFSSLNSHSELISLRSVALTTIGWPPNFFHQSWPLSCFSLNCLLRFSFCMFSVPLIHLSISILATWISQKRSWQR